MAKVKREGAYVGFAGPLRGFAASADISDASEDARALLSAGQSVLALVAGGTGGSRERTLQLQLGHDALAEAAKAEAADGVAEAAAVAGLPFFLLFLFLVSWASGFLCLLSASASVRPCLAQ